MSTNVDAICLESNSSSRVKIRLKQVEIGYNTLGYARYIENVSKDRRSRDRRRHPRTPNPFQPCSKRSFDGQIRKWRRLLHNYDPPVVTNQNIPRELPTFSVEGERSSVESLSDAEKPAKHNLLSCQLSSQRLNSRTRARDHAGRRYSKKTLADESRSIDATSSEMCVAKLPSPHMLVPWKTKISRSSAAYSFMNSERRHVHMFPGVV